MSKRKYLKSKIWFYQKYWGENLPMDRIAQILDCYPSTIYYWLKKHNIKTRTKSVALKGIFKGEHRSLATEFKKGYIPLHWQNRKNKYLNKKWLKNKYVDKKLSPTEIAKICNCDDETIRRWLKKYSMYIKPQKKHPDIPCPTCGGKKYYSSKVCVKCWAKKAWLKERNPNWAGGTQKRSGYIYILKKDHPHASKQKYVAEHRLVMEEHIGRYLFPWEIVHHINGVKDDNQIENLKLLPSGEHNKKVQEVYRENHFLKQQLANFLNIRA